MSMAYSAPDFDLLLDTLNRRWGAGSTQKYQAWRTLLATPAQLPELEKLKQVNDFFNQQIHFEDDNAVWHQVDYWATPLETLGRGAGDCEDFTIAKYFTLQLLDVNPTRMRLTYVKAKIGGPSSIITQAHMVLAYYSQPDAEPLILDNLIGEVRPASRRPDLLPVFSFNSDGIWVAGGMQPKSPVDKLSRWKDLVQRMHREGFGF
ncbi:transglutaminase-like cysteine peptidase [Chitinimonas sp. BJB300]|uniref:transglutaminase-like cysteine peptidase n=2 Tax=Chitinimonas sp. BJB300 TaxID=1559339 RepID=UPI000C10FB8A|nr:transglutaminase-like cysteine peptidase [Chitinimonas sp. BJB300]PHV11382.1 transglutaminase [Chitinimonas sp. BJB300]TSJ88899.1 transglutaminase [Chitinimonas sp. BJB300]